MIEQGRKPEQFQEPLSLSVVIRCGRDRKGLLRCIESIDQPCEIVISAADDAQFLTEFEGSEHILTTHMYGNWSLAAETGVQAASNNDIIMMDSDSVFAEKAVGYINDALKEGHILVQPRVIFLVSRGLVSRLISNARTFENRYKPKSYSPGLGMKREELMHHIGRDGRIYNSKVLYGDDGYLDQMRDRAGIEVFVAENAIVYHDPVTLRKELLTACRFGRGERQIEEEATGLKHQIKEGFFSRDSFEYFRELHKRYGDATAAFMLLWRFAYVLGYMFEDKKILRKKYEN